MHRRTKFVLAGIGIVAVPAIVGAGTALAAGVGDDRETHITGAALERASAAALDHTGGGRVTETEVGDEDGYYEVEVTLDDGRQVDVHLDRNFAVLGGEVDGPGEDDVGGAG